MKIVSVVAARPNFIKIAPFIKAVQEMNGKQNQDKKQPGIPMIEHILVHTGQHYDANMSDSFLRDLNIPRPDINLGIGSGSHAEQVGRTMIEFEKILRSIRPDWVVVVGDVNAPLACTITAKKENIKCCHIEAGLRSGDLTMPEEINRIVTDRLCDLLLVPDRISYNILVDEGIPEQKIKFVGNIMIDTLYTNLAQSKKLDPYNIIKANMIPGQFLPDLGVLNDFAVLTLHRPSNVDSKKVLSQLTGIIIKELTLRMPLIWPVHPRTMKQLKAFELLEALKKAENLILLHPVGYREMLRLNLGSRIILTDSGGLQEECTVLGTPCLTLRPNTERPVTLIENGGVCVLVGSHVPSIRKAFNHLVNNKIESKRPELWDGDTATRCLKEIRNATDQIKR